MDLSALPNGETNEFRPLALVAGTNLIPNILSHREAIKSDDKDQLYKAMEEEIERMIGKEIFEVVPRSQVPSYQKLKGYKSRQVDYVQAFPQEPLEDEEAFMEIPA
eukprot:1947360-Ditylum_brightwellii.AAC.1